MTVEALKRTADRRLKRIEELETAARAMLAALKKINNNWDNLHPKDRHQARAAIAQAEAAASPHKINPLHNPEDR